MRFPRIRRSPRAWHEEREASQEPRRPPCFPKNFCGVGHDNDKKLVRRSRGSQIASWYSEDGRAVHKGTGATKSRSLQRKHAPERRFGISAPTTLQGIANKAKGPLNNNYDNGCCFYGPLWPVDEPECNSYFLTRPKQSKKHKFLNLYHFLNRDFLRECFLELKKNAAPGVDQVDYYEYQENLEENLEALFDRLKEECYRPKLVRRKFILKPNGKLRPLGIPCIEDKIVQKGVAKILTAIYEADFLDCSYGYRPNTGAQAAARELSQALQFGLSAGFLRQIYKDFSITSTMNG